MTTWRSLASDMRLRSGPEDICTSVQVASRSDRSPRKRRARRQPRGGERACLRSPSVMRGVRHYRSGSQHDGCHGTNAWSVSKRSSREGIRNEDRMGCGGRPRDGGASRRDGASLRAEQRVHGVHGVERQHVRPDDERPGRGRLEGLELRLARHRIERLLERHGHRQLRLDVRDHRLGLDGLVERHGHRQHRLLLGPLRLDVLERERQRGDRQGREVRQVEEAAHARAQGERQHAGDEERAAGVAQRHQAG